MSKHTREREHSYIPEEWKHITPQWLCQQIADIRTATAPRQGVARNYIAENDTLRDFVEGNLYRAVSVLARNPSSEIASIITGLKQETLRVIGILHDYDDNADARGGGYSLEEDPELRPTSPEEQEHQELKEWEQAGEDLEAEDREERQDNEVMRALLDRIERELGSFIDIIV